MLPGHPDRHGVAARSRGTQQVKIDRRILLFVAAVALLGVAGGIFETSSNNYYAEVFQMTARQRGALELPREFPGFMVAVMTGVLFFVAEAYLGVLAAGLVASGLVGLAAFAMHADQYANMLVFLVVWSAGTHLMMPVRNSLALTLARRSQEGAKLGRLASVNSLAVMGGAAVVWFTFAVLGRSFATVFLVGAGAAVGSGAVLLALGRNMDPAHHRPRPKLVYRRRYLLFYVLSVLFGARKQTFITFGPWVLIRLFGQPAQTIAVLWIITHLLIVLLLPAVGRLLDRVGERTVLMADAGVLLLVCLSYGFSRMLLPERVAFYVVCGAYVTDQFLFPVQMARTTYLSKIARSRRDISGALGLSVSIDHAVSIPIAIIGGWLWTEFGHHYVFAGAACIAVLTFAMASFVRVERVEHPELVESPGEALEEIRREEV
ncbi:MAG: MFS transporter [Candidatus Brocadiaceae bacterium]|jgi:predicted MFS family arabinose efflux permease